MNPVLLRLGVCIWISLIACFSTPLLAQLSNIHYLPPMYGRDEGIMHRHFILVSNPDASTPANVVIRDGAGNVLFDVAVSNQDTYKAFLGEGADANGVIDSGQLNTVISDEDNLIVQSDIPVYVQIRHTVSHVTQDNPDRHLHGLITSSKGDWAIGSRFRTGFGYSSNSSIDNNVSPNGRSDFISVMATEDDTNVRFSDFNNRVNLGGVPNTPNSIEVILDAGESYTIAHFPDSDASNLSLNGTLVTGSNPIVVNCGSWALDHSPLDEPNRSQREIAAEQIIPMERLDNEYVIMNVDGVPLAEKVILVADQDNTDYFLHGSNIPLGTLDAGEYIVIDKDRFSAQGNLYLKTSLPAPIYQTTGLQHYSVGYTIVTPLKCWGTRSTIIPRMDGDFILEDSRINIVAEVGTSVTVVGADLAPPQAILGLPDYVTYRATPVVTDDIFVTADRNVQVLTSYRSVARGAATYYSEYFQTDTILIAERCQGDPYQIGNSMYDSTGIYYDTLQNVNGCDSLVMLDLKVFEPKQTTIVADVCSGDSYVYQGIPYTETGRYDIPFISADGCDSIVSIELTAHPPLFDTVQIELCPRDTFNSESLVNDTLINTRYLSSLGCDSTVSYQVNILEEFETQLSFTICPFEQIPIGDQFYSAEGFYELEYQAENGCDSLVTAQIEHFDVDLLYEDVQLCSGDEYDDVIIYQDTVFREAALSPDGCPTDRYLNLHVLENNFLEQEFEFCPGMEYNNVVVNSDTTIVEELQNINGCDSMVISHISIASFSSVDTVYLNSGDAHNGIIYYDDDLAIEDLMTAEGCDSTAFTYIFINPILTGVVDINLCPGQEFQGLSPTSDTSYTTSHTAVNGFDSLTIFNIDIRPIYADTTRVHICEGESTYINGSLESEAGLYENLLSSAFNCDSLIITELILDPVHEFDFDLSICEDDSILIADIMRSTAGTYSTTYQNIYSCDSTIHIHLDVLPNVISEFEIDLCSASTYQGTSILQDTVFIEKHAGVNGCDSTVYTHIHVQHTYSTHDTLYVFEGEGYLQDSILIDSLVSVFSCDSTLTTQVILIPSIVVQDQLILCEGDSFDGIEIYNDTTFIENAFATNGADSTVITNITVNYNSSFEQVDFICEGDEYKGISIFKDTTFIDIITNSKGCDSIIYTNIQLLPPAEDSLTVYLVEGTSFEDTFYTSDTTFVETFVSIAGCDSTFFTQIIIIPHVYTQEEIYICENETYLDIPITKDTVLVESTESYLGSDSVHTTYVYMLDTTTRHFAYTSCQGLPINLFGDDWYQDTTLSDLVLNQSGCFDLEVYHLTFNPHSAANIEEEICTGSSFYFNQSDLDQPGLYYDTLLNQYACDSIVILQLSVSEVLSIDVEGAEPYCEGSSTLISATGFEEYLWSNGSTDPQLEVFAEGYYELSIVDQNGCIGIGGIQVPPPNFVAVDVDVFHPDCFVPEHGAVDILTALNDADYAYTLNGMPIDDQNLLATLPAGDYTLMATDEIGCSQIMDFRIDQFNPPSLFIQSIEALPLGDSVRLTPMTTAQQIDSILWSPDQYLSCSSCLYPYASPTGDITYSLTLFTTEGCIISESIHIEVDDDYAIYIPNAFSPNGDGINDHFTIYADGAVEEVSRLSIYDRWGTQVFYQEHFPYNAPLEGWDGTFRSQHMQTGVYVYQAEILLKNGKTITEKGDLTLMQ